MCGTGFGFSVEEEEVNKLPEVPEIKSGQGLATILIEDSKAGWADSVKTLMGSLYDGQNIHYDYSGIRLEGARLMTMGGRASGPAPLVKLHDFIFCIPAFECQRQNDLFYFSSISSFVCKDRILH